MNSRQYKDNLRQFYIFKYISVKVHFFKILALLINESVHQYGKYIFLITAINNFAADE